MPKHPLWFLGFPSHPSYRGVTDGAAPGNDVHKYPALLHGLLPGASQALLADQVQIGMTPAQALHALVKTPRGHESALPVASMKNALILADSFQLLWEQGFGRRVRFIINHPTGGRIVAHIEFFKEFVRIRPNRDEVREVLFEDGGAFFEGYKEQWWRFCDSCFDLYPDGVVSGPKRVKVIREKIQNFLNTKVSSSLNLLSSLQPKINGLGLTGKWTSYKTLEITNSENKKCTIEVRSSQNFWIAPMQDNVSVMGRITIDGADDHLNTIVKGLISEVCKDLPPINKIVSFAPINKDVSAWKVMYDLSKQLDVANVLHDFDFLYADLEDGDAVRRGTATEDSLFSNFVDMTTTPTDSLFSNFVDVTTTPTDSLFSNFDTQASVL